MSRLYDIACDCGAVKFSLTGEPRVRGFCHCNDCRDLLKIPYHSVTAWDKEQLQITAGDDAIAVFQHPTKKMQRFYCKHCGETLYNSNAMDWRIVSQLLIRNSYNNELPVELQSKKHFFYASRIVSVDDDLPKQD